MDFRFTLIGKTIASYGAVGNWNQPTRSVVAADVYSRSSKEIFASVFLKAEIQS